MINKEFSITDELYGYERFAESILNICNDKVVRRILFEAWNDFVNIQRKREDVLPGWGLVETLNCDENNKANIGLG